VHSSNYRKVNGASQLKFILKVSWEREGEGEGERQTDKERETATEMKESEFLYFHILFLLRPALMLLSIKSLHHTVTHKYRSQAIGNQPIKQGCTNPGTTWRWRLTDICGSSVRNLLHVTLLASRILKRNLELWKIFAFLLYILDTLD